MKKIIIILLFLPIVVSSQEPSLYKGLIFNMPINEAKKEFKKNKKEYINISFGNNVNWRIYTQNFTVIDNKLKALVLKPKGSLFGLSHENAKVYLNNSKLFFESKGYKVLKKADNWNIPVLYSQTNKFGLVMYNQDKTVVIELRSLNISSGSYMVNLGISNYNVYLSYLEKDKKQEKLQQDKTGF